VYPQLSESDLILMANELPIVPRYVLNRYRIPENFLNKDAALIAAPYSKQEIDRFAEKVREIQPNVIS
jgi:pyruvate formate lyase activating enzyme